jgi:ADP-dependent NAD(P)H-hydrate dehydratase / NAD(P)H-hydrate epimerase
MRDFDRHAIESCKVPGLVLMENAGRGAADVIAREALGGDARGGRVVVVCGGGNNGGDGFVLGRHLRARGAEMAVFCTAEPARLRGDARVSYDAFFGLGGSVRPLASEDDLRALTEAIARARVVVDALFGTGLDKPITLAIAQVVACVNAAAAKRIAIDIPSGIDADTGATLGVSVRADATVTFGHLKLGLFTSHGALAAGTLHLVDLGVPALLGPALAPAAELLERADIARLLPPRALDVHKYKAGHVGVFAGSGGKTGAALMVARAALRAGAGLATIASWEEAAGETRGRVTEEMVAVLARGSELGPSLDRALAGKKAIVVGPGFGTDDDARAAVSGLLARWKGPALYDADALTLFAGNPEAFARTAVPCVLTPHAGEAARLLGTTSEAVEGDRFAAARALATRARAVVVLKGPYTLIAAPDGDFAAGTLRLVSGAPVAVNPSACPALATAGSGDTLAGLVGAMLCALPPFDAACAGTFLHAAAAEAWSVTHGDRGLLASEIADGVPAALAALSREHTPGPR